MKRTWKILSVAAVVASMLMIAVPLAAQVADAPSGDPATAADGDANDQLTIEDVQAKLATIEANSGIEDTVKELLRSKYQQAIAALNQAAEYTAKAAQYREAVTSAPQQTEKLRAELDALPPAERAADKLPQGSSAKLQKELELSSAALAVLNEQLTRVTSELAAVKRRPVEISARVPEVQRELSDIRTQLASPEFTAGEASAGRVADRILLQANQSRLQSELKMLPAEQASISVREELLKARHDLLTRQAENGAVCLKALRELLSQRLAQEAQKIESLAEKIPQDLPENDKAARDLAREVQDLAKELERVVNDLVDVAALREEIDKHDKRLTTEYDIIRDQIDLGGSGETMAQLLFDVHERVLGPGLGAIDSASRVPTLDQTRVRWMRVQQKIGRQADVEEEFADRPSPAIKRLVAIRNEVLEKLSKEYRNLIRDLTATVAHEQRYLRKSDDIDNYVSEQLFWMRSIPPVSTATLTELPEGVSWALNPQHGKEFGRAIVDETARTPWRSGAIILLVIVLVLTRRRTIASIEQTGIQVRRISSDRYALTVQALLLTLLLAAPIPLVLWYFLWVAQNAVDPSDWLSGITYGLAWSARITLVAASFAAMCRTGGLGAAHFRWNAEALARWRSAIHRFLVIYVPAVLLMTSCMYGSQRYSDSVSRVTFLLAHIWTAAVLWRLFGFRGKILPPLDRDTGNQPVSKKRLLSYALIFALPLVFLVMALRGYLITACELSVGSLASAGLILIGMTMYWMSVRWFALKKRKLALAEAIERRRARQVAAASDAQQRGEVVSIDAEDDRDLDLDSINEQTRQFLRLFFSLCVGVAILGLWSEYIPLISSMDRVLLPGGYTLLNVIQAILIVVITWIAARDIPGLLELSVLRSTTIEAGGRYAIATLGQYILIAIGALLLFEVLNVDWTRFGWIAAALSVGLGFGLQEVVANFVCGLLLLFEQPIRVGDVVTVEGVTGTVTRIRMRATTITNWDRQELVVPNKTLITNSVLNWTLSAATNRIVISVGTAYGSDTNEARQILLDVAASHPLILKDPAPLASFEGFADSSLKLVLRAYLPNLDNRLKTITELYAEIDKRFAEAGIEIPFPQRDLHLRGGLESVGLHDVVGGGHQGFTE